MRIAVSREPGAEREVTPLELFFDLVYICAVSQLTQHLFGQPDASTAVLPSEDVLHVGSRPRLVG